MASHILGIVILDSDGERVVAQYSETRQDSKTKLFPTYADQRLFEKDLLAKSLRLPSRNEVEVLLGNDTMVLYNLVNDLNIYVIGVMNENEICLLEVMNTFYNALHSLTNGNVTKRTVEENMGSVFLLLDELLEDDLVFETDSNVIVNRIQMNSNEEAKLQEQTAFNQALSNAKDGLLRSFLVSHT